MKITSRNSKHIRFGRQNIALFSPHPSAAPNQKHHNSFAYKIISQSSLIQCYWQWLQYQALKLLHMVMSDHQYVL